MAYQQALRGIESMLRLTVCPAIYDNNSRCGARGFWKYHGIYKRKQIRDWVNGRIVDYVNVEIIRLFCKQCGGTHAMLIWFLPPYSRHTLRYILHVLDERQNGMTIEMICEIYQISPKTLYTWQFRFKEQADDYKTLIRIAATSTEILQLMMSDIEDDNPVRFEAYQLTFGIAIMQIRHSGSRKQRKNPAAQHPT